MTAGLRERKKERARQTFIDSTRGLLETMHSSDVTVEAVAELSELSARTFFRYFDTKHDAVIAALGLDGLLAEHFELADDPDADVIALVPASAVGIDRAMLRRLVAERELTTGELIDRLAAGELEQLPAAATVVAALLREDPSHAATE